MDAVSNLMVKYLLRNPAIYIGSDFTFFDYNRQIFFEV